MGPQLKVVERTRTATMLCAASGNPDPDISWFKDFLPVNTTTNNGRIKQLRSGRLATAENWLKTGSLLLLVSSIWSAPPVSFSSSSHDLTCHLPFIFVGNGIVSTTSCPVIVCPVCVSVVCLPLSSSVVMAVGLSLCVCWLLPRPLPHCSLLWLFTKNYFCCFVVISFNCIGAEFVLDPTFLISYAFYKKGKRINIQHLVSFRTCQGVHLILKWENMQKSKLIIVLVDLLR